MEGAGVHASQPARLALSQHVLGPILGALSKRQLSHPACVAVAVAGYYGPAKEEARIVFLSVLAILLKINFLSTMGLIFLIVGGVFSILGYLGHPVGGHRYWH
jgi:hypothetical protein